MKYFKLLILGVTALSTSISFAGSLKNSPVVFKSGNWKVLRTLDEMTDKFSCTGVYNDNYKIQLADDALYLSVQGGIKNITLRFGEQPALPLRLPKEVEKDIDSIIIKGSDFKSLLSSNKLRYEVYTLVSGVDSGVLDLTGINDALGNIKSGCPVASSSAPTTKPKSSLCNEVLLSRMKSQGLKDSQITSLCESN